MLLLWSEILDHSISVQPYEVQCVQFSVNVSSVQRIRGAKSSATRVIAVTDGYLISTL